MRIKTKTILALIATTICLVLILDSVSNAGIQANFLKIEQEEVTQTIGRIQVAVTNTYTDIDDKLAGWSQLNSTYEFIKNENSEYQETYLTVSSLANVGVNFVIFLDEKGTFVTGLGLNLTTMQQIPIPQDIITKVSSDNLIWNLTGEDSPTDGFVLSSGQPLLLASRPILMTNGEGPARGVLIFARYYDSDEITQLSNIMKYSISVQLYDNWQKQYSFQNDSLAPYIKPLNQQYIMGFDAVDDIRGQPIFVIGAMMPRTVFDQGLNTISYIDEALLIAGIVFCATVILLLEYSVLRRLGKLTNAVIKLGEQENHLAELPVSGNDEITWLTLSINGLLQELESQGVKLQKSERLSAIGELARQIGHDLRNPLASIKNAAYYLKRKGSNCTEENKEKMLGIINQDIDRSDKIINDLIEYSNDIYLETDECSPRSLVTGAMSTLQVPENIKVVNDTLDEQKMFADVSKIQRVCKLIIANALDAMPDGGTLEIKSIAEDSKVQVTFTDTGKGISEEIVPKIFTPLLTTKAQGMGLSLAICKRIIDCHGGKIEVESTFGKGSTFKVTLPVKPKICQQDQEALLAKEDPLLHYNTINGATNNSQGRKL